MSGGNTLYGSNTLLGTLATSGQTNNGVAFLKNQVTVSTTLSAGISATDLSIPLTSVVGFPTGGGTVVIDNEQITYASISGSSLTVTSTAYRGVNGTTAVLHSSGAAVTSDTYGSTTLLSDISNSVTSIPVASTSNFPNAGTVLIDVEQISYTSKTATTLDGATRGANGTVATTHTSGAAVAGVQTISTASGMKYFDATQSLVVTNLKATNMTTSTQAVGDATTNVATTQFVQQNAISAKIQPVTAAVPGSGGAGSITVTLAATSLDFRNTGSTGGSVQSVLSSSISITANGSATLGFNSGVQGRIAVLAINNSGTMELALCNISNGGISFDESSLISTSSISSGISAGVVYSTTARSNVAYRVVGYIDATNTSSAWQTTFYAQGAGGNSVVALPSLVAVTPQTASGASVDFAIPINAKRITVSFYGVTRTDAIDALVQIGYGSPESTGYTSSSSSSTSTSGFVVGYNSTAYVLSGQMLLTCVGNNQWCESHVMQYTAGAATLNGGGKKSVTTGVTIVRVTRASGTGTFNAGTIGLMYE